MELVEACTQQVFGNLQSVLAEHQDRTADLLEKLLVTQQDQSKKLQALESRAQIEHLQQKHTLSKLGDAIFSNDRTTFKQYVLSLSHPAGH